MNRYSRRNTSEDWAAVAAVGGAAYMMGFILGFCATVAAVVTGIYLSANVFGFI